MLGTKPEPKFTPGPWEVTHNTLRAFPKVQQSEWCDSHTIIMETPDDADMPTDEIEANAQLIAAAPELLEAAQAVGDYLAFMVAVGNSKYPVKLSPRGVQKLKAMRDAIRKAVA